MRNTMLAVAMLLGLSGAASAEVRLRTSARGHGRSYVEVTSARVMAAFLVFQPARTVEEQQNLVEEARARDALLVYGGQPSLQAGALGAALLGAAVVLTAHAPRALRPLFDGPVHFGPALFNGGGMGAGVGARF